jgi:structural maintenance of chromosome 2
LTKSEELLQTLLTGVTSSSSGNTGGGYLGQIADARAGLTQATTEEEQSVMKLGMSQNELKALEVKWKDVERDAQDGQKKLGVISTEIGKLKKQMVDSGWSEEAEQRSQQQLDGARREYRNLMEVCKATLQLPHCSLLFTRREKVRNKGLHP